ncbi:MAG: energy-coupling factor transporter transmembrane protein EcfT [Nitrososphaerota archaeon]|jgi:energy-coupling factor transport system permease protein|nr:energy-coupling factor transporter transmembrane protein EcfT [Nitrososphaerota archaeon]MDG7039875.1 energy-coupling factor transporter transmembrane protein EcfT [Nitrososphaerota archaeon]MDG7041943.1 energy-coupling factor transporter transmembrane protein EcfT [Nitrososphaerota archaeon]MDG7042541.1 energy-coupling factor transporter transmembrane protein EcfT [Nitrososphaerota archaeon]MDG7046406.1 energy-coupling factor transporter transmembrane protein EcfT [Nitrososphaerota archaeon
MNWIVADAISSFIILVGIGLPIFILLKAIGITGFKYVTRYEKYDSFLYRMNPATKLLLVVLATVVASTTIWWVATSVSLTFLGLFLTLKEGRRKFLLGLYILLMTVSGIAWTDATSFGPFFLHRIQHVVVVWVWPASFASLGFRVPLTLQALVFGLEASMIYMPTVLAGLLLIMTTTPSGILRSLKKIGLPDELNFAIVVTMRIIPKIFDSVNITIHSQFMRGLGSRGSKILWPVYVILAAVMSVMPVLIHLLKEAKDTAIAADTRAFRAFPHRTYMTPMVFTKLDYTAFLIVAIVIAAISVGVLLGLGRFTGYLILLA